MSCTRISKFEVSDIPNAMDIMGWKTASALMKRWFNSKLPSYTWNIERKKSIYSGLATKLNTMDYNDTIVKMSWATKFSVTQQAMKKIVLHIDNENAKEELRIKLSLQGWKYSKADIHLIAPKNVREFDTFNQCQIEKININPLKDTIDEFFGALANCTLKVGVVGKTTKDDKFIVEKYGLYIKDSYDFIGDSQPLGLWTCQKVLPKLESGKALKGPIYPSVAYVTNGDFNKYRLKHNQGRDFVVFSDILWVTPSYKMSIDLIPRETTLGYPAL
jgi:hypothetical protein